MYTPGEAVPVPVRNVGPIRRPCSQLATGPPMSIRSGSQHRTQTRTAARHLMAAMARHSTPHRRSVRSRTVFPAATVGANGHVYLGAYRGTYVSPWKTCFNGRRLRKADELRVSGPLHPRYTAGPRRPQLGREHERREDRKST